MGMFCRLGSVEDSLPVAASSRVPASTGDRAQVEIRGKWFPVRVVQPNFVRHGKALI